MTIQTNKGVTDLLDLRLVLCRFVRHFGNLSRLPKFNPSLSDAPIYSYRGSLPKMQLPAKTIMGWNQFRPQVDNSVHNQVVNDERLKPVRSDWNVGVTDHD